MKEEIEALAENLAEANCSNEMSVFTAYQDGFITGYNAANEWVKCSDRLPEDRHWCIVFANSELFLANYKHGIFETEQPIILHNVTHWMSLPKPPTT